MVALYAHEALYYAVHVGTTEMPMDAITVYHYILIHL